MIQHIKKLLSIIKRIGDIHTIELINSEQLEIFQRDFEYIDYCSKELQQICKKAECADLHSDEIVTSFFIHGLDPVGTLVNKLTVIHEYMSHAASKYYCATDGIVFRKLTKKDISTLVEVAKKAKTPISTGLLMRYYEEQKANKRKVIIGFCKEECVGYGTFVWRSSHPPFKLQKIALIEVLFIFPEYRKQGFGSMLLESLEGAACAKVDGIGIAIPFCPENSYATRFFSLRDYKAAYDSMTVQKDTLGKDQAMLWLSKWMTK